MNTENIITTIKHNISGKLTVAIVIVLVLYFAFYLRTTNQLIHMQWIDDSARDITISMLVSDSNQYFSVRPHSGGLKSLKNSSLYYDLLALLYKFSSNFSQMLFFYTLIQTSSLLFAYGIGKKIGNSWLGIGCMLVLATNLHLISAQQSIYQRNILPFAGLAITYLAIEVVEKKKMFFGYLLLGSTFFFILLHNAIIALLIPVGVTYIYLLLKNKSKHRILHSVVFLFIIGLIWLQLTDTNIFTTIHAFITKNDPYFKVSDLEKISGYSFAIYRSSYPEIIGYILVLLAFTLFVISYLKKDKPTLIYLLYTGGLIIFWIISAIFLGGAYANYWFQLAFYPLWALIPLLTGYKIASLLGNKFFTLYCLLSTFLIINNNAVTMTIVNSTNTSIKRAFSTTNEYGEAKKLVENIKNDFRINNSQSDYPIIIDSSDFTYSGWFSPAFLYFMDNDVSKIMNISTDHENNLEYSYTNYFDSFYMICHNFYNENDQTQNFSTQVTEQKCLQKTFTDELYQGLLKRYPELDWVKDGYSAQRIVDADTSPLKANVYKVSKTEL